MTDSSSVEPVRHGAPGDRARKVKLNDRVVFHDGLFGPYTAEVTAIDERGITLEDINRTNPALAVTTIPVCFPHDLLDSPELRWLGSSTDDGRSPR